MSYPDSPGFKAIGPGSEAALKVAQRASTVRERVLQFLRSHHPASFTPDQIADRLNINFLTVRPRISELHLQGEIEPDGTRGKNTSGMSAQCWRAAKISAGGAR
ncbi:HTH domain-containing protein [Bradyrhizobium betae]|uniref:Uncharacterized protein n=1 Tax=Bradyrhizobium betae TaxID=244734 RepID=A0A4Q1VAC9_9BRAD|nr:HTH domain-containing protein [Bradyrhizobium betae]RXT48738.1 hypothetical protein B5V03_12595 [Bradyrhizobium betae]